MERGGEAEKLSEEWLFKIDQKKLREYSVFQLGFFLENTISQLVFIGGLLCATGVSLTCIVSLNPHHPTKTELLSSITCPIDKIKSVSMPGEHPNLDDFKASPACFTVSITVSQGVNGNSIPITR